MTSNTVDFSKSGLFSKVSLLLSLSFIISAVGTFLLNVFE